MIKDNLTQLRQRIARSCARAGRQEAEVTIVAVSKGRGAEEIKEAIGAGITDIAENRVQEALLKYKQLSGYRFSVIGSRGIPNTEHRAPSTENSIKWHLVGHLQTNKARDAVRIFDLIHSVDSLRLAEEINKQAAKMNKTQDVLLEVKTSPETTKFGVKPEEAPALLERIGALANIKVRGLMTIAPLVDNPEQARPYFQALRRLRDKIYDLRITHYDLRILSMGMTDDFEAAIEEGVTMIRIGRGI
ncbi:MAG: YggS family pyridoxal phosphate-dependent enzyme, partial [Candidatus Omnitrophota bacterium]|nr:YggS family pyridoxal phosphate-dependent enzyme [Candidatus Omnitrophota bacterium]